jgi:hypothetical protein
MRRINFETERGSGQIEYINIDEFEVYVEETYSFYTEEDVIYDIERNIYKYL